MRSTLKEKNLLLKEQILLFKSGPPLRREAEQKLNEFFSLESFISTFFIDTAQILYLKQFLHLL